MTTFGDLYPSAQRPVISFEVFPPKTEKATERLRALLPELVALRPEFMTVTFGAGGSTRAQTLDIASGIQRDFGVPSACHLTCVGSSRADLDRLVGEIYDSGVRNIVALRGDPPQGETTFTPAPDGLRYGNELVTHIRGLEKARGWERLGLAVAGYPEKHVEAPSMESDLRNLKRKVDAGADCVVTQLFYDNRYFFDFVKAARAMGITVPIVPGLLPIVSVAQVKRITAMCGTSIPAVLAARLEDVADDESAAEDVGVAQCIEQATELLEHGAPGIHFYVLNRSSHVRRILEKVLPERVG